MATRSRIRRLFARKPRTVRKAPARFRPAVQAFEDRIVLNSYTAATAADLITDIGLSNQAGGKNTITLSAPTSSPYTLNAVNNSTDGPTGLPVISKKDSLTIVGNGDTIDASHVGRLFDVAGGGSLMLENLTLQNGQAQAARATGYSADGGAIFNQGTLVLSGVTVQFNTAPGWYGGNAAGGGIWSNGSLTLQNSCLVQGNSAVAGYGGASNAYGGGICVAGGAANITGTQFGGLFPNKAVGGSNNYNLAGSAYGGAVCVLAGTVTLSGDILGGPIGNNGAVNQNVAAAGIASSNAHGYGYGGGLCVLGGTVTLTNDVVENNTAGWEDWGGFWEYAHGGGIYIASGATVSIDSFTQTYTFNNTPTDINYG